MGRSSQAHKLDVRGSNSLGARKALAVIKQQHGSDTVPALLQLNGLWGTGDTISVNTDIGAGNVLSQYTPGANEDAFAAATGLALVITAQTDHTAVAAGGQVYVTKTTAGSVDIVNQSIA